MIITDQKFFKKLLESYSVEDFTGNLGALLDDPDDRQGWEFVEDLYSIASDYTRGGIDG